MKVTTVISNEFDGITNEECNQIIEGGGEV